jgi:hypothetical protein
MTPTSKDVLLREFISSLEIYSLTAAPKTSRPAKVTLEGRATICTINFCLEKSHRSINEVSRR